ncbi:hypothetical protein FH039_05515 [Thermococcus indicus]|uniref:Uncharacterized protein n=1 Tax=Thermococcus indicus TaxID=2586643 RepID=A0A4Y5SLW3_9EURY|nr:hypothetical protein [Thermococcus indicus]QDA31162.1 hypothetical protein FH039_05515 [Thermococcus indicus]
MPMKRLLAFLLLTLLITPFVLADDDGEENEYEAGYTSLAVAGVAMITAGVAYYTLTKRKLIITHQRSSGWGFEIKMEHPYMTVIGPMSPMTIHHFFTITGTLLVFLHFFSCGNYTGLAGTTGLAMAVILILLNVMGFIGRSINHGIISAAKANDMEKARKYVSRYEKWKKLHILLAIIFAVLLAAHLNAVD